MRQQKYFEAYLDDYNKIIVYMSRNSYEGQSSRFYIRDCSGFLEPLTILSVEQTPQYYNRYTLMVNSSLVIGREYYVMHEYARSTPLQYANIVKTKRFDEEFYYDGKDLGAMYSPTSTIFKVWAPTASRVRVEFDYHNEKITREMKRENCGIFASLVEGDLEESRYTYHVYVNGEWKETIDPYGIASDTNGRHSVVIDRRKLTAVPYVLPITDHYSDAILYEASIRDFTMQENCGVTERGGFAGFVEENHMTKSRQTGFSYLKSLGITHVQLMPVMDFGSVDEFYPQLYYNWGYDPVQARCPEGSYARDSEDPYSRIRELIRLVEECHKNGIKVNLDVVFNHVYDVETHPLNNMVPYYYFQMNENGEYSNGTFCGNDIDSLRKMCRRFIIDTCRYLQDTFLIDGFRFDLMGILDMDTVNEVYWECAVHDPDFMVYGEGWDMPSLLDYRLRASLANQEKMPHIAHFSDRFRDVVKGRTAANEVNVKGYISGDISLIEIMKNCLSGSVTDEGGSRMFHSPQQVINYVECHDNMTAWDKLKECCKEDTREIRMRRQEMLNACVLLAQGIPFLHSGQEFARTKHGLNNTYHDMDSINMIDYERRDRYREMVDHTKALIQLRRTYECFRYSDAERIEKYVHYQTIDGKVLIYEMDDEKGTMQVIFNPLTESFHHSLNAAYKLLYYNGSVQPDEFITAVAVEPVSTIVLWKEKTS